MLAIKVVAVGMVALTLAAICSALRFRLRYHWSNGISAGIGADMADLAVLIGRLLIALLFALGALQKTAAPEAAGDLLIGMGLPYGLVWVALVYNAFAAGALIVGYCVRPVAASLAAYCALTSVFHYLPEDPWQMSIFVKNWAIAGGCLVLAAHGPGRYVFLGTRFRTAG